MSPAQPRSQPVTPTAAVAVVGPGQADAAQTAAAEQIGEGVAAGGADLVCGGLGGVMEAACRGAARAGGHPIGLLPGTDRGAANPYVRVAIPTGLGEGRNLLIVRTAAAVVAVGGGWGTLSEIALARRAGIAVIGLETWRLRWPDGSDDDLLRVADPAEAVALALRHAGLA